MKGAYVHEQSSYRNWICKHFHPFSSIEWHGSSQKIIQMKTVPMSDGKLGIWMISGDFDLIFDRCLLTRDEYCNYTMHKLCRVSESNTQDVSSVWLWFDVFVALAFLGLWLSWCFLSLSFVVFGFGIIIGFRFNQITFFRIVISIWFCLVCWLVGLIRLAAFTLHFIHFPFLCYSFLWS